jgi:quercetin dioxygenase-like cupin family protein
MSRAGEVYENPITGERVVVRRGTEESGGDYLTVDLYVAPGGAVAGEHVHQDIEEVFMVLRGKVGFRLDGLEDIAEPTRRLVVPPGVVHDWWNAGQEEAHVIVELHGPEERLERFEMMISTLYGLARDAKTGARGRPGMLQTSLLAREFDDVIVFSKPPRSVQRVLFGALAPVAYLLGLRASYPEYGPSGFIEGERRPERVGALD